MISLQPTEQRALLERFLRYVQVDTQSDESSPSYPSTDKQKNLARQLVNELRALGCKDAAMTESGHVYATVPSNLPPDHPAASEVPVLGFLAHLDTYPGTSGARVKPQVVESYAGGDLVLPATGAIISAASQPNLGRCVGHTLIHTDGTTLLGADDKAGIAEIVTLVDWLFQHPEFPRGKLRVAFTPDEEIGRGIDRFDLAGFGAHYAYTLDGSDLGEVEDETFSADAATITIVGHDVHPGLAKNVMINAVRVASAIVAALPADRFPESTEGREPYLHPYSLTGDVARAQLRLLVRAFTEKELLEREEVLRETIRQVQARFPGRARDSGNQAVVSQYGRPHRQGSQGARPRPRGRATARTRTRAPRGSRRHGWIAALGLGAFDPQSIFRGPEYPLDQRMDFVAVDG